MSFKSFLARKNREVSYKDEFELVKMRPSEIVQYIVQMTKEAGRPKDLFNIVNKKSLIWNAMRAIETIAATKREDVQLAHADFIEELQKNAVTKNYTKHIKTYRPDGGSEKRLTGLRRGTRYSPSSGSEDGLTNPSTPSGYMAATEI